MTLARRPAIEQRDDPAEADVARRLYEDYRAPLYRFCLSRLRSREEAEDALQLTFLYAFAALRRGVRPELTAAWLFTIARNVCLSTQRAAGRRRRVESPRDLAAVPEAALARPPAEHLELLGVEDALAEMSPRLRRVVLLREWQGLSYREIAAEVGVTQSAVETLVFRARRELARRLDEPWRRLREGFGVGPVTWLKGVLEGSAALKLVCAAAIAVVAVATPVAAHDPAPTAVAELTPRSAVRAAPPTVVKPAAHPGRTVVVRHEPQARRAAPTAALTSVVRRPVQSASTRSSQPRAARHDRAARETRPSVAPAVSRPPPRTPSAEPPAQAIPAPAATVPLDPPAYAPEPGSPTPQPSTSQPAPARPTAPPATEPPAIAVVRLTAEGVQKRTVDVVADATEAATAAVGRLPGVSTPAAPPVADAAAAAAAQSAVDTVTSQAASVPQVQVPPVQVPAVAPVQAPLPPASTTPPGTTPLPQLPSPPSPVGGVLPPTGH